MARSSLSRISQSVSRCFTRCTLRRRQGSNAHLPAERAGIHDPTHFACPTYAKAAASRRENLKRSADELKVQLDDAKAALGEAFEELKKVENNLSGGCASSMPLGMA